MWQYIDIDIQSRHKSAKYESIRLRNNTFMQYLIQQHCRIKYVIIALLYLSKYIFSIVLYNLCIFKQL